MVGMELRKRKSCDNCGAPLPGGYGKVVCPYCGTTYTFDSIGQIVVLEKRAGVIPLSIRQLVPWESIVHMGRDRVIDIVAKEMAHRLAEEVMKNMHIETEDLPLEDSMAIRCSIRLLDDHYAF